MIESPQHDSANKNMIFALTHARSLSGAPLPGLEMVHLVVDLIHHLVERLHREQVRLQNDGIQKLNQQK